jgi:hypothetical protein
MAVQATLFTCLLSKQFANAFTSSFKFLKFRWSGITLFKEFRLPIYEAAQNATQG